MKTIIQVDHFRAAFGKKVILKDVSFTLTNDQLVVILGENGAGKTTLVKAILNAALSQEKTGAIQVQAENVAYVPQFRDLGADYPLSIRSFIALGVRNYGLPWLSKSEKQHVADAIQRFDLEAIADQPIAMASGGQKQRAYIAQAVAKQPDLLILDEPSSALDSEHTLALVKQIRQVQQEQKMLVLWISHDTSWVKGKADRYLWLHNQEVDLGLAKELPVAADSTHREEVNHVF